MLKKIKEMLLGTDEKLKTVRDPNDKAAALKRSQTAICALLLEIANFDGDFHEDEKLVIDKLVKNKFGLTDEEARSLIELSNHELKESIDLWHFTKIINANYDKKERVHLLEMLWEVVYADGHLHGHEDFLVHKLAKLLQLEHKDLIGAKIRVKKSNSED